MSNRTRPVLLKNARSLDTIAGEIHSLERKRIFTLGNLLIEAKDACEHGEWLDWLQDEFDWHPTSAERYMNVARLGTKFSKLQNLGLAKTTLYALLDEDEDDIPVIVEALTKRAAKKRLKANDANVLIEGVLLRKRFGDLPDQTLRALDRLVETRPWYDKAVAALKRLQPTTSDKAAKVIEDVQSEYVSKLYGKLPDVPPESLHLLERVPEERRGEVLEQLTAEAQPLTGDRVREIVRPDSDARDDDDPEPETPVEPSQEMLPTKKDGGDVVATCVREVEMIVRAAISGMDTDERLGLFEQVSKALANIRKGPASP